MATRLVKGPYRDETFITSETFASSQYHAVKIHTDGLAEVGAANERCIGIAQGISAAGAQLTVRTAGQSLAMVDGTTDIAINDPLDVDASGHLVKQETDKGWIVGYAREAYTSATPGLIVIDINPQTESV